MSPPERENRPAGNGAASSSSATTTADTTDVPRQLRRRRAASCRLPALEAGLSDPWHYDPPTAGYQEAADHLLELGLCPAPNREALQAMRRRGGRSFRTAKIIADRWGGAA